MTPEHAQRPLHDLLDDLAADTPAPGGGSAAAWATAMAAGLVEMAASFAQDKSSRARVRELRARAVELAERELRAYGPVLAALQLPRDDPARAERLSDALSDAADSPLDIARTAAQVAVLAKAVAAGGKPLLEGDANTAALLAEAACRAAARLVEINLANGADDPRVGEARTLVRRATGSAGPVDPRIDEYAARHTTAPEGLLAEVAAATAREMRSPGMMSGRAESRLLEALVTVSGGRRVLEVGTFTGFGALSMAEYLPENGELITIEYDEAHAEIARGNIERSSRGSAIELIVGDAHEELQRLAGPYDLVFIDAWKPDYVHYYETVLPKLSPRGIIVADNVLWNGEVLHPEGDSARAVDAFNKHVNADERVRNVLLTVGDGLMLIWRAQ